MHCAAYNWLFLSSYNLYVLWIKMIEHKHKHSTNHYILQKIAAPTFIFRVVQTSNRSKINLVLHSVNTIYGEAKIFHCLSHLHVSCLSLTLALIPLLSGSSMLSVTQAQKRALPTCPWSVSTLSPSPSSCVKPSWNNVLLFTSPCKK